VSSPALFAGTANAPLAARVAELLGVPLAACDVQRFPDGEVSVVLRETVRHRDAFVIQPTAPPVDTNVVELLAFGDACRRAAAERRIAVVPYFGYGRSDRRSDKREPIGAGMVAACLEAVGFTHVITVDMHTPQIEGFFRIPVDSLSALGVLADRLRERMPEHSVVVAPDAGRVKTATALADRLGVELVILHKRRESGSDTTVRAIVGDVTGRACILIDDMISTGGTIEESIAALRRHGAGREMIVAATHGLFVAGARERLRDATTIVVTDTTAVEWPKPEVVSVAPLIADAIRRMVG
jgi:ribose-phosphate pyrophosphokinase